MSFDTKNEKFVINHRNISKLILILGEIKKLVAYLKKVNRLNGLDVREECVLKKPPAYFRRKKGGIGADDVQGMYKLDDKKMLNRQLGKLNGSLDGMLPKAYLIE